MAAIMHHVLDSRWKAPCPIQENMAPKTLICAHLVKERIFYTVLKNTHKYYKVWDTTRNSQNYDMTPPQNVVDDMKTGPWKFSRFKEVCLKLDNRRIKGCPSCSPESNGPSEHSSYQIPAETPISRNSGKHANDRISSSFQLDLGHRTFPAPNPIPLVDVVHRSEAILQDNASDFDDYLHAPIAQETVDITQKSWSFDGYGNLILETCWSTWIDRGWRLMPRFFSMFENDAPAQHEDHLLPTMAVSGDPQTRSNTESSSWDTNDEEARAISMGESNSNPVPPLPATILGFQGMLDEAGLEENTKESQSVFVCGKTRGGGFIGIDPKKDAVDVDPREASISSDLDSLMYSTFQASRTYT
jgi:hypothetical protein